MFNLGQFQPLPTPLHLLDPRVKIGGLFALSVLVFTARGLQPILISAALAILYAIVRMSLRQAMEALRPLLFFLALIFLVHLLFTPGTPLITMGPLAVTGEGLGQGLYVTWQFASLVLGAALLTATTSPSDIVAALELILRPFSAVGVPSQRVALMVSLAFRFVPLLLEEYDRLRIAHLARGADFTCGSLASRLRTAGGVALLLMLSAFRRADELALAIAARGYHEEGRRTNLRELKIRRQDKAAIAFLLVFVLLHMGLGGSA